MKTDRTNEQTKMRIINIKICNELLDPCNTFLKPVIIVGWSIYIPIIFLLNKLIMGFSEIFNLITEIDILTTQTKVNILT